MSRPCSRKKDWINARLENSWRAAKLQLITPTFNFMKKLLLSIVAGLTLAGNIQAQTPVVTTATPTPINNAALSVPLPGTTAQTPAPATDVPTFLQSVQGYLTSINTNFSYSTPYAASVGYKQVTGNPAAGYADVDYSSATNHWTAGIEVQFFGIGSSLTTFAAGGGYNLIDKYDTRLNARLYVGDDFKTHSVYIEPQITVRKKLTENTFAGAGISFPYEFKTGGSLNPTFEVETGFTF